MSELKPLISGAPPARSQMVTAIDSVLYAHDLKFENMIPAIVVEYDRNNNKATVTPAIATVFVDESVRTRQDLVEIPTLALGGGNFVISFPLKKGDLGWIHAADRDLDEFKSTLAVARPNNGTLHKFGQGMFIPDIFRQYTINEEDEGAMVIQSTDGATRISIRGDNIKITAPTGVVVDTPLTTFTGDVNIEQNLNVAQSAAIAVEATVAGIAVTTHGHISSTPGNRTADGMIA